MPYTPNTPWHENANPLVAEPGSTSLSAERMNRLETQYQAVVDDIGVTGSPVDVKMANAYAKPGRQTPIDILAYGADPTGVATSNTALKSLLNNSFSRRLVVPSGTYKIGPWAPGDFEIPEGTSLEINGTFELSPDTTRTVAIAQAYYATGVLVDDTTNTAKQNSAVIAMNTAVATMPDAPGLSAAATALAAAPTSTTAQSSAKTAARNSMIYENDRTHFLTARGTVANVENPVAATIASRSLSFTAVDGTKYNTGDLLMLFGSDFLTNTQDRYGYQRQVTGITGNAVSIEGSIPRSITSTPRTARVVPKQNISITGTGGARFTDPINAKGAFLFFQFCRGVSVDGIYLRNGGGSGVWFDSCINHRTGINFRVERLLDDDIEGSDGGTGAWVANPKNIPGITANPNFVSHFGYGVNESGASRGGRFWGKGAYCRHIYTTNIGATSVLGNIGEPEGSQVWMRAEFSSSNGIDTHRAGFGIEIHPNIWGCTTGANVRSDQTRIIGGIIGMSDQYGITVSSTITAARQLLIEGVTVVGVRAQNGIQISGANTIVRNTIVKDIGGIGISVTSGTTGVLVDAVTIDTVSTGVNFQGSNAVAMDVTVSSATTPWVHGGTNNRRGYRNFSTPTSSRPGAANYLVGMPILDTTLGTMIYSDGTAWKKIKDDSAA